MPLLRCLFCDHRNRAGAKYCDDCASPLHLQPCNQCGGIDNRAAENCYKCGAQFSAPAEPKRARARAAPKRASERTARKPAPAPGRPEPAAANPAPAPAATPPVLEDQIEKPVLNRRGFTIERFFLSKSPAQAVEMLQQGSRREVIERGAAAGAVHEATHLNPDPASSAAELRPSDEAVVPDSVQEADLAHSAVEPQPMDKTLPSERALTTSGSRGARPVALLILLLAATAVAGYYYYDRSAHQLAQMQSPVPRASSTPDAPIFAGGTKETLATQGDALLAPKNAGSHLTTDAEEVDKAPRVVAKPRTNSESISANRPLDGSASVSRPAAVRQAAGSASSARPSPVIDAGVKSRRDPPIFKDCTEAVAALGLCSPIRQ